MFIEKDKPKRNIKQSRKQANILGNFGVNWHSNNYYIICYKKISQITCLTLNKTEPIKAYLNK